LFSSGSGQLNTRARISRPGKERFSPLPNSSFVSFVSKNLGRAMAQHLLFTRMLSQAAYYLMGLFVFQEN
jgi:hypothetical protein